LSPDNPAAAPLHISRATSSVVTAHTRTH
jgi:hypothetical protein